MRNIVEHGQTSGSSDTIVLSGVSASSRFTRWISVPTPMTAPGGRGLDRADDEVGRADLVGHLARPRSGTRGARRRCRRGARPRNASTCSGRKRWCTEQWPFHSRNVASLQSASVSPPRSRRGFQHAHVVVRVAHREAGVATEVLVGEEQHLGCRPRRPSACGPERPLEHGAGVGRGAHRAAVLADERLQRGRRVHVGDRDEAGRCR